MNALNCPDSEVSGQTASDRLQLSRSIKSILLLLDFNEIIFLQKITGYDYVKVYSTVSRLSDKLERGAKKPVNKRKVHSILTFYKICQTVAAFSFKSRNFRQMTSDLRQIEHESNFDQVNDININ